MMESACRKGGASKIMRVLACRTLRVDSRNSTDPSTSSSWAIGPRVAYALRLLCPFVANRSQRLVHSLKPRTHHGQARPGPDRRRREAGPRTADRVARTAL